MDRGGRQTQAHIIVGGILKFIQSKEIYCVPAEYQALIEALVNWRWTKETADAFMRW